MKPVFYPYKMKSSSAKLLSKEFGAERVKPDGKFMNNFKRPIINWGNSKTPEWMLRWPDQVILNHPHNVLIATNKLSTFKKFKEVGVKHPEWTTDYKVADTWFGKKEDFFEENEKNSPLVVARKTLTGKGGEGIVIYDAAGSIYNKYFNSFPLYTKYFKKKHEYRVHVVNGKVVDFVQKKAKLGVVPNFQVRSYSNGWAFCREGVELPQCVKEEAIKAVAALNLTFGAVDVGYNVAKDEPCVFEVNTAPGIEGTTVQKYKEAFMEML